ncbi:hypothetical protein HUJ05_006574, partial [Dendroctonus ponderosae]
VKITAKIFTTEEQNILNNLKVEHENLVAKWLQNSFKLQENAALDLRSTPLQPLQISPQMTEVNNRPIFKMNNDFWNQARGPPQNMPQNLSNSNQNSPVPGSTNSLPAHSPSQQSNSSQIHVITPGALALQQAQNQAAQNAQNQQVQQNAMNSQQPQQGNGPNHQQQQGGQQSAQGQNAQTGAQGPQLTPTGQMGGPQGPQSNGQVQTPNSAQNPMGSPNPSHMSSPTPQSTHGHPFGQPNMMGPPFGSGANSPDKMMTEKIVNELQLLSQLTLPDFNQLQRNSSAISERTLEECWTTLQRNCGFKS